jgi:hypothetical protein
MSQFTGTITVDDREVKAALKQLADKLPDGQLGRVYSRGAVQQGRQYEHYVMSRAQQAPVHQGRWQTEESIAASEGENVANLYRRYLRSVVDGRQGTLRGATGEALELLYKRATDYPPPPPNSTYIRTYTLQRSWDKENQS